MPGRRVEANVTWLQLGFNSSGPDMCRASSPPFPIPWRVVDGGMKSKAKIHVRASTRYVSKHAQPPGTDGLGQRWTTCATSHFCVGHVLTVMDTEYATQAPLVKGIHAPWLTLPLSLSRPLLYIKRQAGHIQSKGEACCTRIYWSARCCDPAVSCSPARLLSVRLIFHYTIFHCGQSDRYRDRQMTQRCPRYYQPPEHDEELKSRLLYMVLPAT